MRHREQGLVLIIVLIFLQILFLLGWSALTMNTLEIKMNRRIWQHFIMQNLAEQALMNAQRQIDEHLQDCMIAVTDDLAKKPVDWWQAFPSCTDNFQTFAYYYLIEPLGEDPCAYVDDKGQEVSVDYFRLNLLGLSQTHAISVRLQSTFIKPHVGATLGCHEAMHRVTIGRQMWRPLI